MGLRYSHWWELGLSETAKKVKLGNSDYEVVDQFCYIGDTYVECRWWCGSKLCNASQIWMEEIQGTAASFDVPGVYRLKGKLSAACVRSGMLYGSETWPVKEEDIYVDLSVQRCRWLNGCVK